MNQDNLTKQNSRHYMVKQNYCKETNEWEEKDHNVSRIVRFLWLCSLFNLTLS